MSITAGLVGLPNVGKSTLFNALTKSSVPAANYPFCTIDPHVACTAVPDIRIGQLQKIYGSQKLLPATVQFTDIAGLVKGAAQGEGLGNQFLSHIRETNLILHVLRCFSDGDIIHTQSAIDPVADYEIIMTELMLKDLEMIIKRIAKIEQLKKSAKNSPAEQKELAQEFELLQGLQKSIDSQDYKQVQKIMQAATVATIPLLSTKNFLIIANVSEAEIGEHAYENNPHYQTLIKTFGSEKVIPVCAKLEHDLSTLPENEAAELATMMGIDKRGIDGIIEKTYANLGLITFFTAGPKEIHAWPIPRGMNVRKASGEIHSDLERGFICAEVWTVKDIVQYGSEVKLKEVGKMRTEGQDYIVQDGDILNIRFNV
ncbi:MAG: GTP-binding protein YchF [candidate division TM6 bacterium GW2011_GWE2_41_16]|nr:MAG: GTP-binding protein YchF [candidate division TM6 bacterium GW2011_GWE2_41_16]